MDFWQCFHNDPGVGDFYPARLEDGRYLRLPLRVLPDGRGRIASLILNQASFAVVEALAAALAESLRPYELRMVVGLPTLGLTLAAAVARALGHTRYVPLGTSRKFWYDDGLSVPLSSVTSPKGEKRLYIDPRMVTLLAGRRVALVDDVISSGVSMAAGIGLLAAIGVKPVVLGAAMLQTEAWADLLRGWEVAAVLRSPLIVGDKEEKRGNSQAVQKLKK